MVRLQEESISMAFVYMHKYQRWVRKAKEDQFPFEVEGLLDDYTIALTSLVLATKSTESPRRLRELLLPAYSLLHPSHPPLTFPSYKYDNLRDTLVNSELIMLRVLKFDLLLPLPYQYLEKYLSRVLVVGGLRGAQDLDDSKPGRKEEYAIVEVINGGTGRKARGVVYDAMKNPKMILYPARVIAAAAVYITIREQGFGVVMSTEEWVAAMTDKRVEACDLEEILEDLGKEL
ncbi:hypothetical protein BJ508DRAFT_410565 [Ascobolus immersus RN42]|uniref:Uncharacterized protein n=1 Tax=Ascobolus immersus RN42 TaxID=1160509 RepID=A0A3N4IM72_ASCIM|nr:hypothetical protein BJ508DRAFT_410565 [Ascobolus immersus RN42]